MSGSCLVKKEILFCIKDFFHNCDYLLDLSKYHVHLPPLKQRYFHERCSKPVFFSLAAGGPPACRKKKKKNTPCLGQGALKERSDECN